MLRMRRKKKVKREGLSGSLNTSHLRACMRVKRNLTLREKAKRERQIREGRWQFRCDRGLIYDQPEFGSDLQRPNQLEPGRKKATATRWAERDPSTFKVRRSRGGEEPRTVMVMKNGELMQRQRLGSTDQTSICLLVVHVIESISRSHDFLAPSSRTCDL